MAEIQTGPSVLMAPPAAAVAGSKPGQSDDGVFANVLSGRVSALSQTEAPGKGQRLAAFAGKAQLAGLPGLIKAGASSGDVPALDPALLAAFMGNGAGVPADPALLSSAVGQLVLNQLGLPGPAKLNPAELAVDGKQLPELPVGSHGHKPSPAASVPEFSADGRQADGGDDADSRLQALLKGGNPGAQSLHADADTKVLFASAVKVANAQAEVVPVLSAAKPVDQMDSMAMAGLVQHKAVAQDAVAQAALTVRTPVQAPTWGSDFGQKIVWLVGREMQSAQLVLNPPQMGTVEVRLTMAGNEAGAQFFSPHQGVREAIEAAIPRLRDMMAEAGLSLGQTSVSQESFRHADGRPENAGQSDSAQMASEADGESLSTGAVGAPVVVGQGLVDLYV